MTTDPVRIIVVEGHIPANLTFEEQVRQSLQFLQVAEERVRQNAQTCAGRVRWRQAQRAQNALAHH